MIEFRLRSSGAIISEQEYKDLHPETSFAADFVPADADRVHPSDPPAISQYQRAVRDGVKRKGVRYVWAWRIENWTPEEISAHETAAADAERQTAKAWRSRQIANIIVTVNGKAFQGDEISQGRMMRKIVEMGFRCSETTRWRLADNTDADVTLDELQTALTDAAGAQSAIIFADYKGGV